MQGIDAVDQPVQFAVGVYERPDVEVGKLDDPQPVETGRQPVGAYFYRVYMQRRTSCRSAPHHDAGDAEARQYAEPGPMQCVERVEADP